ncbi:MAG TPA: ATP-binding protein, partial [Smithella sp.]|nr:ATP-binding protein [Smithella sp.]
MLQATERLQSALLNSVSHDLRTPLAGIAGVLSTLKEFEEDPEHQGLDRATRQELLDTAWDEVERLNRYVGNLLEMTRLESGVLRLRREVVDVQDFIGAVVQQMRERLKAHQVKLNISVNLPPILIDFLLFSQVMVNLLDNAIKYSPAGSLIEVSARQEGSMIEISVLDRGAGVPQQDLSKVFDKFYRVQRPSVVSGTGLGLAISKGIVEAHG